MRLGTGFEKSDFSKKSDFFGFEKSDFSKKSVYPRHPLYRCPENLLPGLNLQSFENLGGFIGQNLSGGLY